MFARRTRYIYSRFRQYYTVTPKPNEKQYDLSKHLYARIKSGGPITVSDYMKEVLINPLGGYYMHKDMFGEAGDFVTSPELGQIFGEMIAIWFLNEWSKVGSPKPFQIVELGPGKGSLCQDILRVFHHFDSLKSANVQLVEVSPVLSDLQARKLCATTNSTTDPNEPVYKEGKSVAHGTPIKWYKDLKDVPNMFTLLIAHEFFDALPIHKFRKTPNGYREVLIDIDENKDLAFRYVLAKQQTPALKLFLKKDEKRDEFEVSPQSLVLVKDIATRLEEHGGLALIADYGHNGEGTDTFRAYKKHQQHNPLIEPGSADLTADVDFLALKDAATEEEKLLAFGPVTQREFLQRMGIDHRVKALEEYATKEQMQAIKFGYDMMTDPAKMGTRFKFLSLLPAVLKDILNKVPVVGFY